jgi:hypothetical protein
MEARKMSNTLTLQEEFELFDSDGIGAEPAAEAEGRRGDADGWRQSERRTTAYTKGISQMHVSRLRTRALRYLRSRLLDPEEHLSWLWLIFGGDGGWRNASRMRWRRRVNPARPYICRLIIFVLVFTPSVRPLCNGSVTAAITA